MKNKTVIILLSVLAVAMYTVAVINFCLGDVLKQRIRIEAKEANLKIDIEEPDTETAE